jgi:hypothetical protein
MKNADVFLFPEKVILYSKNNNDMQLYYVGEGINFGGWL